MNRKTPSGRGEQTSLSADVSTRRFPPSEQHSPWLLRAIAVSVFVFPANLVLAPVGAPGYVASILAIVAFGVWATSATLGLHDPIPDRSPARLALGIYWLAMLLAYAEMQVGLSGTTSEAGRVGSERVLTMLFGITGIAFGVWETVRSPRQAFQVVRALSVGATFCGVVAAVQFFLHLNPVNWIATAMPILSDNGGATIYQIRGALVRVAGTTFTPIELGVVSAMLLPLLLWRAVFDSSGSRITRWAPIVIVVFSIAATVSRSGLLGLLVVVVVAIPFFPSLVRRWAVLIVPVLVAILFVAIPGLVSTLLGSITAGRSDASLTTRLDNYPRVVQMVSDRPWTGTGPGTYLPENALEILDNQYLRAAVETGIPGALATILLLVVPGAFALIAAINAKDPALRALCGSTAGAGLAAAVLAATFDAFSFPVYTLTYPFVVGLSGATWLMVKREVIPLSGPPPRGGRTRTAWHPHSTQLVVPRG